MCHLKSERLEWKLDSFNTILTFYSQQTDIIIQKTSNSINQIDKNLNKLTLALKEWINCVTKEKNIMSESLESVYT